MLRSGGILVKQIFGNRILDLIPKTITTLFLLLATGPLHQGINHASHQQDCEGKPNEHNNLTSFWNLGLYLFLKHLIDPGYLSDRILVCRIILKSLLIIPFGFGKSIGGKRLITPPNPSGILRIVSYLQRILRHRICCLAQGVCCTFRLQLCIFLRFNRYNHPVYWRQNHEALL